MEKLLVEALEKLRSLFSFITIAFVILPLSIAYIWMCHKEDYYYQNRDKKKEILNNKDNKFKN